MKVVKYNILASLFSYCIFAQSIVIGTGSSIEVGTGSDICAGVYGVLHPGNGCGITGNSYLPQDLANVQSTKTRGKTSRLPGRLA